MDTVSALTRSLSSSAVLCKFLGKGTDIRMDQILQFRSEEELKGRRTHIVCTMGPSCWDVDKLVQVSVSLNVAQQVCDLPDRSVQDRLDRK